ncbi:hypothetical protein LWI28_005510 [Acer negundo]|uniref:Uncharacterized protein n=1 Tax=Acer negundo TaxID=4023 RepID=A0AAD5IXK7_ACENE|nr:hypothetical protein LWI28_005510 [Acer negundo]
MASSLSNVQSSYHVRSNSLPSRPHPITSEVDQHLSRLRSSQATSTSSLSSICLEINGHQDLPDSVDKLLQLPLTHQALGQEQQKKSVDELLNGSLRILDVSSIAKDILLQTKECAQELSLVLRRRRGDEISSEVKKYLTSRKAIKKTIKKALKGMVNKCSSRISEEHESVTKLREVEAITFAVFESLVLPYLLVNVYFIKTKWLVIGFQANAIKKE